MKNIWKPFLQVHDDDLMENIFGNLSNPVHDLEGKVSIYVLH
jgi:hypothetical protein